MPNSSDQHTDARLERFQINFRGENSEGNIEFSDGNNGKIPKGSSEKIRRHSWQNFLKFSWKMF